MAGPYYVRSSDGNNTDTGLTWALAKATIVGAGAVAAAGETIYVSQAHAESNASAQTFAGAGTLAAPVMMICGNDAAEPPTTAAATATVTTTGANSITLNGALYCHGISFNCGSGAVNTQLNLNNSAGNYAMLFEKCQLIMVATGTSAYISVWSTTNADAGSVILRDTDIKCGSTGATAKIVLVAVNFEWMGGTILSGDASGPALIAFQTSATGKTSLARITGVDLSNMAAATNLVAKGASGRAIFRDCRLPTSWSGSLISGTPAAYDRVEIYNCSDGATNYRIRVQEYAGTLADNTSTYRNSGYSMDGTSMSWQVTGAANAKWPLVAFYTPEFGVWVSASSGYTSVTVAVATDNITLTDKQCWLEVVSLQSASYPIGTRISDDVTGANSGNCLASASNQTTDGTSTWTGVPGTPVLQKLTATIAPGMSGYLVCRVGVILSGSQSVYIDPHPVLA